MIGRNIQLILHLRGWGRVELAQRLGCSVNMIDAWVIGNRNPNQRSRSRIAKALGVPEAVLEIEDLPERALAYVRRLRGRGNVLAESSNVLT